MDYTVQELEVRRIMQMWAVLEHGYSRLTPEEQRNTPQPYFSGFDGNYEIRHYGTARRFLADGEFFDFKGRELNAHMPVLHGYRAMLLKFDGLVAAAVHTFTRAHIVAVLAAEQQARQLWS